MCGSATVGEVGEIDAMNLEFLWAGAVAIQRNVLRTLAEGWAVVGGRIGSRRQGQNLGVVASAQWKLSDGLRAYSGPQRGRGRLQSFRLDFDRHLLALRADFQSPVEYLCLGYAHRHRGNLRGLESRYGEPHSVGAGRQQGKPVTTVFAGGCAAGLICVRAGQGDRDAWDDASAGVGHGSRERPGTSGLGQE